MANISDTMTGLFESSSTSLGTWDVAAVTIYFVLVMAVGLYAMCRPNRGTVTGYFLAGRYMCWMPVGASLFASNIGSEHFIGLAGSGAAAGIAVGAFELNALIVLQLLGWVFLPVYIASGVSTLPEYMNKRFGGQRIRIYLSCLSVVLYIFTKISVDMYTGALFIQQALHWDLYLSILLLLAATAVLTVTGGLAAVIYTDTLQFFIIIGGAVTVMFKSFSIVGGWEELHRKFPESVPSKVPPNTTCGVPPENSFMMLREPLDPEMPWPAFILGQTPASIWYWCADQMMVQRALASKSLSHAQGATIFAGYFKILPLFMIVMPGMISRVLFKDEVGCVLEEECMKYCGNPVSCTNSAYPRLVMEILPPGMRGVMLAVMLAALMSDLTSIFNSASTLFTMDIYPRFKKAASNKELVIVGRAFTVLMVFISIAWIPLVKEMQGGQLYIYIQSIAAYLSPPIAAVYILAITWKRMNENGAFYSLMVSTLVGIVRMVLEFSYKAPRCWEEDERPSILRSVHYMYFAVISFWLTIFVAVVASLMTEKLPDYMLIRTTYWTKNDKREREDEKSKPSSKHGVLMEMKDMGNNQNDVEVLEGWKMDSENQDQSSKQEREPLARSDEWDVDTESGRTDGCLKQICDWMCGFKSATQEDSEQEQHFEQLKNLDQTQAERMILRIFLIIILFLGVSLYLFFSFDRHETKYLGSSDKPPKV